MSMSSCEARSQPIPNMRLSARLTSNLRIACAISDVLQERRLNKEVSALNSCFGPLLGKKRVDFQKFLLIG